MKFYPFSQVHLFRMADYHMEVLAKHERMHAKPLARFMVSYRCGDRSDTLGRVATEEYNADVSGL